MAVRAISSSPFSRSSIMLSCGPFAHPAHPSARQLDARTHVHIHPGSNHSPTPPCLSLSISSIATSAATPSPRSGCLPCSLCPCAPCAPLIACPSLPYNCLTFPISISTCRPSSQFAPLIACCPRQVKPGSLWHGALTQPSMLKRLVVVRCYASGGGRGGRREQAGLQRGQLQGVSDMQPSSMQRLQHAAAAVEAALMAAQHAPRSQRCNCCCGRAQRRPPAAASGRAAAGPPGAAAAPALGCAPPPPARSHAASW